MISHTVRNTFLDFFKKEGHEVVPSSSLVPQQDPTLMFTNSGMVQFKNIFTGLESRLHKRATTAQKCVRAGGKHNDLENVGFTARHHTFFEMLGNFSFGDYFKEEAISFAWNLITKEFGIDSKKLLVTVYSEDHEAHALWKKIAALSDEKIIRIATTDNFWSMGDTGPCGPCSEIFYDHGAHIAGGPPGSPDENGDRFVEIWNLVFMQFEQMAGGERIPLPKPCIDTGMGLERVAAVLQGKHDNFDTDILRAIIDSSIHFSHTAETEKTRFSHRVIADHLRSSCFLIADGVLPSNEGRGYVLRRIMRRAMRHAHLLGCKETLMWQLVPTLVQQMGESYPELKRAESLVTETLKLEEERFKLTLEKGLKLLDEETSKLKSLTLPGAVAFKLYDTYGFPLDLTETILKSQGKTIDQKGFDEAMDHQKQEARKAWTGSGEQADERFWFEALEQKGPTEFLGYETEQAQGQIVALGQKDQNKNELKQGEEGWIICNQTPFYGESGGQAGDCGLLKTGKNALFQVKSTFKKAGKIHVHLGIVQEGLVALGDDMLMEVDHESRKKTRANHSATHLLHEALRQRLGESVSQKGSLVNAERLRFDFSYNHPLTDADIHSLEEQVNEQIQVNANVDTHLMGLEDAQKKGAMALFGEKYHETVRVVSMGGSKTKDVKEPYSLELCGGTHVVRTGDIGLFKIIAENSVAAGVRRIEGLTGLAALKWINAQQQSLQDSADVLKTSVDKVAERLKSLMDDKKKLEREVDQLKKKMLSGSTISNHNLETIQGVKVLTQVLENVDAKDMRSMIDQFKKQIESGIVILFSKNEEDKVALMIGVTADLVTHHNAINLVREMIPLLGGQGGGGRAELAQSGGSDSKGIDQALQKLKTLL
jgi:alanyl-tRNA synthetase